MLNQRINPARRERTQFRHRLATPANDHRFMPGFTAANKADSRVFASWVLTLIIQ